MLVFVCSGSNLASFSAVIDSLDVIYARFLSDSTRLAPTSVYVHPISLKYFEFYYGKNPRCALYCYFYGVWNCFHSLGFVKITMMKSFYSKSYSWLLNDDCTCFDGKLDGGTLMWAVWTWQCRLIILIPITSILWTYCTIFFFFIFKLCKGYYPG